MTPHPEHPAHPSHPNDPALDLLTKGWAGLISGPGLALLEQALKQFLPTQRWFGAKSRTITAVRILDWADLPAADTALLPTRQIPAASSLGPALFFVEILYAGDHAPDLYQLPLAYAAAADMHAIEDKSPNTVVLRLDTPAGAAILHDAVAHEDLRQTLLRLVAEARILQLNDPVTAADTVAATLVAADNGIPVHLIPTPAPSPGLILGAPGDAFSVARGSGHLAARISSAEQSNTNIFYGDRLLLKLFRRLQPGLNPDIEIGRFLTEVAHFPRIAPFLGEITLKPTGSAEPTSLAMLQGLIQNEGDGWAWTLDQLATFFLAPSQDALQPSTEAAALLGQRTAEMHLALATPTGNKAFTAEPFTAGNLEADKRRIDAQLAGAFSALEARLPSLPADVRADVEDLLGRRAALTAKAQAIASLPPGRCGHRIRIHGDYHLGQVLRAVAPQGGTDYVILDFEGEPARTLAERRAKQSPLKDVAGMMRSYSYAAYSALANAPDPDQLRPWAARWAEACANAFLDAYVATVTPSPLNPVPPHEVGIQLLNAYLLEKALYELLYELNNRPAWLYIPLTGILALPD